MRRIITIVALIVLGVFCYFSFQVVNTNDKSELKKSNDSLTAQLAAEKESNAKNLEAQKADKQRVRDALVIMFPSQKEGIDNAFNPQPATQPTTKPTTAPVAK